jgi:D-alanine-D-alanine ligase
MTNNTDKHDEKERKVRVGVLFGGRSGEHEVSLQSARSVINALDPDKYDVVLIGITKSGRWLTGNVTQALEARVPEAAQPATLLPDPEISALMEIELAGEQPVSINKSAELDVVFPVLHGPYGEDGTVQGLLELAGLPYVGAGVVGSAVGMDKAIFKAVMESQGIPILPWQLILSSTWRNNRNEILTQLEHDFRYPLFTKPANMGSSVGIKKCGDRSELAEGLDEAAKYDRRLIVEQGIDGRELEVSVLGNDAPIASVVGEIRPRRSFYDYVAKYISDDSELLIPAPISDELAEKIRTIAVDAFKSIDGAGLGRVDFLLERESNELYINEINTIPGFTNISMYPKLWEATGISYSELIDRLIDLALERSEQKARLVTTYLVDEHMAS